MAERKPMGIGALGFNNVVFKRKFRFTFTITNVCGNASNFVPEHFVKVAARPNLEIDQTEINFLNAKTWIPGKGTWQSITVSYIDAAVAENKVLFGWLASVYNFLDPINLQMGSSRSNYSATGILKMWDGCGSLIEIWVLDDMWPTNINFGEVSYASSEESTIELTLRYSNVFYEPVCPKFSIQPCCTSC